MEREMTKSEEENSFYKTKPETAHLEIMSNEAVCENAECGRRHLSTYYKRWN